MCESDRSPLSLALCVNDLEQCFCCVQVGLVYYPACLSPTLAPFLIRPLSANWKGLLERDTAWFFLGGGCLRCSERGRRLMGAVICMLMCVQGFSWSDWFMGWEPAVCGGQEGLRYTNLPVEHLSHNIKVSFIILYSQEMTQYVWKSIANQTKTKQWKLFLFSKIFRDQFKIHILQLLVAPQFPVCVVLWDNGVHCQQTPK